MRTLLFTFSILVFAGLTSCEKDNIKDKSESYIDYLQDKSIIAIHIQDSTKYIYTSRQCSNCYVAPQMSHIPTIEEWTIISGKSYKNYSPLEFSGLPISGNNGNFYKSKENIIYELNGSSYDMLLNTGEYKFTNFTFDNENNIWLFGDNNGIAFWNKSELKIYNSQNSQLLTDRIHGLMVDKSGIVWVSLDFKGLLKIENDNWTVIPNSEIPGLTEYSYLIGPKAISDNCIWFEVFSPDTTSNILRLRDNNWEYEFPDNSKFSKIIIDSKSTIWTINNNFESSIFKYTTLSYFKNNSWVNFDVSDIKNQILTVNADDSKVYIGTTKGLIEKAK